MNHGSAGGSRMNADNGSAGIVLITGGSRGIGAACG